MKRWVWLGYRALARQRALVLLSMLTCVVVAVVPTVVGLILGHTPLGVSVVAVIIMLSVIAMVPLYVRARLEEETEDETTMDATPGTRGAGGVPE